MVVIKIEMWPHGREEDRYTLGVAKIINDGEGTTELGDYNVELGHAGRFFGKSGVWKRGRVVGHQRELSPYHLVFKAIKAALGIR